jgi:uroporphyrinogen decarboxylase
MRETMTGRERWLAVLRRETPDRVPMDYWGTEETTANLCRYFDADQEEVWRRLHIDLPLTVRGRYVGPTLPPDTDAFGVSTRAIDYGAGVYNEFAAPPLAGYDSVDEIEAQYQWPSPDWWDYSHLVDEVRGQDDKVVRAGGSEVMLVYKCLRGEEQGTMDLMEHPDMVHYCLGKLFDIAYEDTRRIFEAIPGRVDISYVAEDLGGQAGLLYSPAHIHEFMLPGMARMAELVRQAGSTVFTHSDGAIREIVPALIAMGMQVLNPIQWRCAGMEREGLKRDFGDTIILHGGVDNQHTLPFGSPAEVASEVRDNLRILGAGGGYILAPCHNIQSITPVENIITMYETGYADGWHYAHAALDAIANPY